MGTADFAVPALRAVARSCDVVLVVTQPDRPRGRGQQLGPSPVAEEARALGLAVAKPVDVNEPEWRERLAGLGLDLVAVVAYGAILAPELLGVPRLGCVNLHGSLLPDYRGASPVQRALWDGRIGTGATTLWMDEGIDTGDCILQRWVGIEPADNAGSPRSAGRSWPRPCCSRTRGRRRDGPRSETLDRMPASSRRATGRSTGRSMPSTYGAVSAP